MNITQNSNCGIILLLQFFIHKLWRLKMAGIFAKYVTDKKAEEDGVWVENEELVNDDDTVTAFKIKRISISNTSYQAKINEPLRRLDALNKNPNNKNTAKDTVDIQRRLGEIYVDEILVDWRNVKKPAELDENGNFVTGDDGLPYCEEVPFSKSEAKELLCHPDRFELLNWLMQQSSDISKFLITNRDNNLKS